jgi:hypothetical protein
MSAIVSVGSTYMTAVAKLEISVFCTSVYMEGMPNSNLTAMLSREAAVGTAVVSTVVRRGTMLWHFACGALSAKA